MFKILFFLRRREGMSAADFQDYYEEKHALHNQRLRPASADYRRNYPRVGDPLTQGPLPVHLRTFDVMTENWYAERAAFENIFDIMVRSPAARSVEEDEARFEIRAEKRIIVAEEVLSPASGTLAPAWNDRAGFKLIRFVTSQHPPSPDFRADYEANRAPLIDDMFSESIDLRRSYLKFDDPLSFIGPQESSRVIRHEDFPCDLIEEIWYESRAAAQSDRDRCRGRKAAAGLEHSSLIVVDECRTPRP